NQASRAAELLMNGDATRVLSWSDGSSSRSDDEGTLESRFASGATRAEVPTAYAAANGACVALRRRQQSREQGSRRHPRRRRRIEGGGFRCASATPRSPSPDC